MKKFILFFLSIIAAAIIISACRAPEEVAVSKPREQIAINYEELDEISAVKALVREIKPSLTLSQLKYDIQTGDKARYQEQIFPDLYSDIEGVLTFRGNNYRDTASWGTVNMQNDKLEKLWEFSTGYSSFGGGGGWTGQPVIVRWPEQTKQIMNIKDKFKEMQDFTEVIFGSLDGRIYFFELASGEQTREPIDIKNTIKGSVAVDPRGYPLLYAGQGINESGQIGYRIFSLIDGKLLYFINGKDSFAYRSWGAFDGAPLINKATDTMILGGENGLLYRVKLNTKFNIEEKTISITPELDKLRYKVAGNLYQGIENSVAVYSNIAYFADNGGSIHAVDISSMKPLWAAPKTDDTDASIAIRIEDDIPYLYTGCEVDKQGSSGMCIIRKLNGLTGEVIGRIEYPCKSLLGDNPVNGGLLASPIIGKGSLKDCVIFTIARYQKLHKGLMVALDCKTGKELWKWEMPYYSWSSPVAVYDKDGKGYIIQGDSTGQLYLLNGTDGSILDILQLGANIESSPAAFNNYIVIATRGGKVYGIKLK